MKIQLTRRYGHAQSEIPIQPQDRLTLDQAHKIKAIMDRTAQELKKVTGENPGVVMADVKGFVFVKRYEVTEQILVEGS